MYVVFKVDGFQFRAEEGTLLKVPRQSADKGAKLEIPDVMLVNNGEESLVGTPYVDGAKVQAEVVRHGQEDKVVVFKLKRRTKYRKRQGHRQDFTEIKVSKIVTP